MSKVIKTEVFTYAELKERRDSLKQVEQFQAVEKAAEWLREANTDEEWWDMVYEEWTEALAQIGFENAKINFSGFSSQGDGASFTANINVGTLAEFLSNPIEGKDCVDGDENGNNDYRAYIVYKCGRAPFSEGFLEKYPAAIYGDIPFDAKYKRLIPASEYIRASVVRSSTMYSHERTCDVEMELCRDGLPKIDNLIGEFEVAVETLRLKLSKAIYKSLEAEYEHLQTEEAITDLADANDWTFTASGKRFG